MFKKYFEAKKSLGQNFLHNETILDRIADAADITSGEIVFEIGPGTGLLTKKLLERGAQVIALEADERAVRVLKETFAEQIASGTLVLHHGDIRTETLTSLSLQDQAYKVVANIPYYLSGMLFKLFLEGDVQPKEMVLLVQKEVAERIARNEKESILSLSVKFFGTPHYVGTVKRGNFNPVPNVDSAILAIKNISRDHYNLSPQAFFALVKEGMKARRKKLSGNIRGTYSSEAIQSAFETCNISIDARGEDCDVSKWVCLGKALNT